MYDSETALFCEKEADALNRATADCYEATSVGFCSGDAEADRALPFLDLQRLSSGSTRPRWPNGAPFAVCLTHDVDHVSRLDPRMHLRRLAAQSRYVVRNPLTPRALRALRGATWWLGRSLLPRRASDPLHCYEQWLAMESSVGAKSTFFFLPGAYDHPHYSDGGYRYTDQIRFDGQRCSVAEMIRELHRRGCEIGLHGSWYSVSSAEVMKRDKQELERIVDAPVVSLRQHHLHFDIRFTPRVCHEAGIRFDSSLGFNDRAGFRMGTCWPWRMVDLVSRSELDVLELPLIVQDKCLVFGPGRDIDGELQRAAVVAESVKRVGGVLTLLWHPSLIADPVSVETYRQLLTLLEAQGAWFGTLGDIGTFWSRALMSADHPSAETAS